MTDRLELSVADLPSSKAYPWLTASVIPRPIAWVSTTSAAGVDNVAPHSFTTVAGIDPPSLCFVSTGVKDTLRNIRETGEFVVNFGTAESAHAINESATDFPAHISEFDAAQLEREPSKLVRPPRVATAPVSFECRAAGEHAIGPSVMTFGTVVHIAVARYCVAEDGLPDAEQIAPLSRLGRAQWARLGEVFSIDRISYRDWRQDRD